MVNGAICSHSKDGPGTIMKLTSLREEMKIGYKQLFLFAGISAGIHHGDGKSPCGLFLGYAKTKQAVAPAIPVSFDTDIGAGLAALTLDEVQVKPGGTNPPAGKDPSLMALVKGHSGGFYKPLYPVFKDGFWALQPVPPHEEENEGVLI